MPIEVTLPFWLLGVIVGTPILFFVLMVVTLWRRQRRLLHETPAAPPAAEQTFGQQIHQQALAQQVDAIFNALTAVIDAEKRKLKALALNTTLLPAVTLPAAVDQPAAPAETAASTDAAEEVGQTAVAMAADGLPADQISRVLGLSHSEVALALKIRELGKKRKLAAVA